ncbi:MULTISPECIES: hypothetical protein [unclassified Coleofasciculus]|uniref:hypothetical protein n=1 Tax=unclassified Coleofasciculus TaxID=2692782 RepID=UPI001882214B|nr:MULTISPECIES: hypothetical protein [unclassified Coleofasciculus]MBE9152300.1 hypothetical protein [Coleofasciculus sp. LEGE 07092]
MQGEKTDEKYLGKNNTARFTVNGNTRSICRTCPFDAGSLNSGSWINPVVTPTSFGFWRD